jgi:hypothetical protein
LEAKSHRHGGHTLQIGSVLSPRIFADAAAADVVATVNHAAVQQDNFIASGDISGPDHDAIVILVGRRLEQNPRAHLHPSEVGHSHFVDFHMNEAICILQHKVLLAVRSASTLG